MFGRKKRNNPKGLYYVFPVSNKAARRKYYLILKTGIIVGLLVGGLMGALIYFMSR